MLYSRHILNALCREMGDEKVAYYSSIVQFDALCGALSANSQHSCEVALLHTLADIRIDVIAHMSVTAELGDMYRGARKTAIMIHDGVLTVFILVLSFIHSFIHSYMMSLSFCGSELVLNIQCA